MMQIDKYYHNYDNISNEELFKEYLNGKKEIEDILVYKNINLVYYAIRISVYAQESSTLYSIDDFESVGLEYLLQAIRTYDLNRGYNFSTYAVTAIKRGLWNYCKKNVNEIKASSLDERITDDSKSAKLMDFMSVDSFEDVCLSNDFVMELLSKLPADLSEIMRLYFIEELEVHEIAKKCNVSTRAVGLMLKKAIITFRNEYEESFLSDDDRMLRRFNGLTNLEKECLILYLELKTYRDVENKLNINRADRVIKKILDVLGCDLDGAKELIEKNNISIDNIEYKDSNTDKLIISRFLLLTDSYKKYLIAYLSNDDEYKKKVMEEYGLNTKNFSSKVNKVKVKMGLELRELKNCFEKYNVVNIVMNMETLDNKSIIDNLSLNNIEVDKTLDENVSSLNQEERDALNLSLRYSRASQLVDIKLLNRVKRKAKKFNCTNEELIFALARK